jgi:hypothetical protein
MPIYTGSMVSCALPKLTYSAGLSPLRMLKHSGNYLKKNAARNFALGILCLAIFLILLVTSIDVLPYYIDAGRYNTARGIALGLMIIGWYYFLVIQYRNFRAGIIGEQRVTRTLSTALSDEFSLFSDVKLKGIKGGNIDHIVVGPTGIFVIETKNIGGKVSYYGDNWEGVGRRSPSRQARINAMRIKKILASSASLRSRPFWIQGIVVIANHRAEITERKPPEYVKVTKIDELTDYIKSETRRFEDQEIEKIEAEIKNKIEMNE